MESPGDSKDQAVGSAAHADADADGASSEQVGPQWRVRDWFYPRWVEERQDHNVRDWLQKGINSYFTRKEKISPFQFRLTEVCPLDTQDQPWTLKSQTFQLKKTANVPRELRNRVFNVLQLDTFVDRTPRQVLKLATGKVIVQLVLRPREGGLTHYVQLLTKAADLYIPGGPAQTSSSGYKLALHEQVINPDAPEPLRNTLTRFLLKSPGIPPEQAKYTINGTIKEGETIEFVVADQQNWEEHMLPNTTPPPAHISARVEKLLLVKHLGYGVAVSARLKWEHTEYQNYQHFGCPWSCKYESDDTWLMVPEEEHGGRAAKRRRT